MYGNHYKSPVGSKCYMHELSSSPSSPGMKSLFTSETQHLKMDLSLCSWMLSFLDKFTLQLHFNTYSLYNNAKNVPPRKRSGFRNVHFWSTHLFSEWNPFIFWLNRRNYKFTDMHRLIGDGILDVAVVHLDRANIRHWMPAWINWKSYYKLGDK